MKCLAYILLVFFYSCTDELEDQKEIKNKKASGSEPAINITDTLNALRKIETYPKEVENYLAILEKYATSDSRDSVGTLDSRIFGEWVLTNPNPARKNDTIIQEFFNNGFQSKPQGEYHLPQYLTVNINNINWLIQVHPNASTLNGNIIWGRSIQVYYIVEGKGADEGENFMYTRYQRPDADWEIWKRTKRDKVKYHKGLRSRS